MRRVLIAVLSLVFSMATLAGSSLRMKIDGPVNNNRYFLYVTHVGAVSILNGNAGRAYPIVEQGNIQTIMVVDASNMSMHPQRLPASCNISVDGNQTVTVRGTLVQGANGNAQISNMRCSVN